MKSEVTSGHTGKFIIFAGNFPTGTTLYISAQSYKSSNHHKAELFKLTVFSN